MWQARRMAASLLLKVAVVPFAVLYLIGCVHDLPVESLDLASPGAGEHWQVGDENAAFIEWTFAELTGTIRIELYHNDEFLLLIDDAVDVTEEEYTWTVPANIEAGSNYQILLSSNELPDLIVISPYFHIDASDNPSLIEVISPKSGDKLQAGIQNGARIEWNYENLEGDVTLDLYHADTLYLHIADSIPVEGMEYLWTIPVEVVPDQNYEIYIESEAMPYINDLGKGFRIDPYDSTSFVELITPENGTEWSIGVEDGAVIEWSYNSIVGYAKIELEKSNSRVAVIVDSVNIEDGSFTWTVPVEIEPANNYRVYIESLYNPDVNDNSSNFKIVDNQTGKSIEVTSPGSGDKITAGEEDGAVIEWTYSGLEGTIRIDLYNDDVLSMTIVDSTEVSASSFTWTIPNNMPAGNKYSIYVESNDDPLVSNMGKNFQIQESENPSSIEVVEPGSGDRWQVGAVNGAVIVWEFENLDGTIKIDLYREEQFYLTIKDTVDVAAGTYRWTVPDSIPDDRNYQVYVESHQFNFINNLGRDFRIDPSDNPRSLEVTTPGPGDKWQAGEPNGALIEWEFSNISGTMKLELFSEEQYYLTILDSVEISTGSYTWTVPRDVPEGRSYQVYAESNVVGWVNSFSREFRIDEADTTRFIEVTEPGSGDKWYSGVLNGALVNWEYNNLEGSVKINLYHEETYFMSIVDEISVSKMSYLWTVPDTVPDDRNYQVYIESNDIPAINNLGRSFRIDPGDTTRSLEITEPSNGDRWNVGEVNGALIEWEFSNLDGTIKLDLYHEDEYVLSIVDQVDVTDMIYTWTVPDTVTDDRNYQIYIQSNEYEWVFDLGNNFRIDPSDNPPEIEVTTPRNNDRWTVGEIDGALIEWEYSNLEGTVKIDLYYEEEYYRPIVDEVDITDMAYTWTVPDSVPDDNNYQVYIESNEQQNVNNLGRSFRIDPPENPPTLEVTSPRNGDRWQVGEEDGAVIEWEYENLEGTIKLDLYYEEEYYLSIVDEVDLTDLSYTWTVPDSVPDERNYQVYIESNELNYVNDLGNNFRIDPPVDPPTIEVTSPGNGDRWQAGEEDGATIEWEYSNIDGTIKIELFYEEEYLLTIVDEVDLEDQSYTWTVPDSLVDDNSYQVYIELNELNYVNDLGNTFRIDPPENPPLLEVTSPRNGDRWQAGEEDGAVIEWEYENIDGSMKIELYYDAEYLLTITEEVEIQDQTFTWTVPDTLADDNSYQVYIESNELHYVNDLGSTFRIDPPDNPPMIEITEPGNGDRWQIGVEDDAQIEWEYESFDGTVTIDLYHEEEYLLTIVEGVDVADQSYTWTVSDEIEDGQDFHVYIESDDDANVFAFSRGFRIDPAENEEPGWIELTAPGQGDSWVIGEEDGAEVEWEPENIQGTVTIQLMLQNNVVATLTEDTDPEEGSFVWTVPEDIDARNNYRIYIVCNEDEEISDTSSNFRIVEP